MPGSQVGTQSLRSFYSARVYSPILPSATLALHQPETDELAAQSSRVLVIACQNLVDLLFAVPFSHIERLHHIAQDRLQLFTLRREGFQTAITA